MYERWTVGDNNANKTMPEIIPLPQATLVDDEQPNGPTGTSGYTYDPSYDTNDNYILIVHGWNEQVWEKDRWAENGVQTPLLAGLSRPIWRISLAELFIHSCESGAI